MCTFKFSEHATLRCSYVRSHSSKQTVAIPHIIKRPRTTRSTPDISYITVLPPFWNVINWKRPMETGACYPLGRRLKIGSLYPNPICPNNFLEADPNMYFGLPNILWTCVITWAIMTRGTFYHVMFQPLVHFDILCFRPWDLM